MNSLHKHHLGFAQKVSETFKFHWIDFINIKLIIKFKVSILICYIESIHHKVLASNTHDTLFSHCMIKQYIITKLFSVVAIVICQLDKNLLFEISLVILIGCVEDVYLVSYFYFYWTNALLVVPLVHLFWTSSVSLLHWFLTPGWISHLLARVP